VNPANFKATFLHLLLFSLVFCCDSSPFLLSFCFPAGGRLLFTGAALRRQQKKKGFFLQCLHFALSLHNKTDI